MAGGRQLHDPLPFIQRANCRLAGSAAYVTANSPPATLHPTSQLQARGDPAAGGSDIFLETCAAALGV